MPGARLIGARVHGGTRSDNGTVGAVGNSVAHSFQFSLAPIHFVRVHPDLDRFETVLLDLDGTVYHEEDALPGAIELIRQLQAARKPYACLTNSTTSPEQLS